MENRKKEMEKYVKAKKRVDAIKGLYFSLIGFIVITILLLIFKRQILDFFIANGLENENWLQWMEWNILAIPLIWGLILLIKGVSLFVFKSNKIKDWEERQIQKYLESDEKL